MSRLHSALAPVLTFWIAVSCGHALHAAELETLRIASKDRVHEFRVEVARTERELGRGLMFRRKLAQDRGLLFYFPRTEPLLMWMKNTYISLDMIFIHEDGRIERIAENTTPRSTRLIRSGAATRAVLEVNAGAARRLGIAPGDRVMHPLFASR